MQCIRYSVDAGYEIRDTTRYSSNGRDVEACLVATKDWNKGDQISNCLGCLLPLSVEEDEELRAKGLDFSIMQTTRKGSCLFLGPARFMNVGILALRML